MSAAAVDPAAAADPPPDAGGITLDNWLRPPHHRAAFRRVRELVPTALIARGDGEAWPLPPAAQDPVAGDGSGPFALDQPTRTLLADTDTDAFVVLHSGRLVHEEYRAGMTRHTPHLCMSVSKSLTATAIGSVIGSGLLSPSMPVTDLVPEFAGTGLSGATVRHLLDMRAGTAEEITTLDLQRAYYATVRWAPPAAAPTGGPATDTDSRSHFWRFVRSRPHGGDFEYRSTLTCVLGLLAERATGVPLPELISQRLWQPLGAERDADITVDGSRYALCDIGISCTAMDLARVGEMLRLDGRRPDGTDVVPAGWVADTLTPERGQANAFGPHGRVYLKNAAAYYRNQWWVYSPRVQGHDGIYLALGIHGQLLYIDEAAEVVIAKFSSWPVPWDESAADRTLARCLELAAAIGRN